jgi:hypothetical protein
MAPLLFQTLSGFYIRLRIRFSSEFIAVCKLIRESTRVAEMSHLQYSAILTQSGCALTQSDAPLTLAGVRIREVWIRLVIELLG